MRFKYRLRDFQGGLKTGNIEADNKKLVIEALLEQKYYLVSLEEIMVSTSVPIRFYSRKVKTKDLVVFTRQMATMLTAGLSIMNCLNIMFRQTSNPNLQKVIGYIKDDIESGLPLWEALARHPQVFSRVYISLVRVGELGGVLDTILERLSHYVEREHQITTKLRLASIYPATIFIFTVVAVFTIITVVMPRFLSIFQTSGMTLPLPTRILLGIGVDLKNWIGLIFLSLLLIAYLLRAWAKTRGGRMLYSRIALRIPIIGKIIRRIIMARFTSTVGILVKSGIPVLQALEVVEKVIDNAVIEKAVSTACASIKEGASITSPLKETGVFEPMVTQMIAVGEETGSLDDMLVHLSEYYEREVTQTVDILIKTIEPVMIIFAALLVGSVIVAILMPMFNMVSLVGV